MDGRQFLCSFQFTGSHSSFTGPGGPLVNWLFAWPPSYTVLNFYRQETTTSIGCWQQVTDFSRFSYYNARCSVRHSSSWSGITHTAHNYGSVFGLDTRLSCADKNRSRWGGDSCRPKNITVDRGVQITRGNGQFMEFRLRLNGCGLTRGRSNFDACCDADCHQNSDLWKLHVQSAPSIWSLQWNSDLTMQPSVSHVA